MSIAGTMSRAVAASQRVARDLSGHASSVVVTYKSDGETDVTLTDKFGLGGSNYEIIQDTQLVDQYRMVDFLIAVADLQRSGTLFEPAERDRIEVNDGTNTRTYEVVAPNPEPAWRFSDRYEWQYRIHTKLISET